MAKKGSCGGTPRVGKKGDTKPQRGRGRRRAYNSPKNKGQGSKK